jgi:hypothetical protein
VLSATTVSTGGAMIVAGSIDVGEKEFMVMPSGLTEPPHLTDRGNHRQECAPAVSERIDVLPPPECRPIRRAESSAGRCW